MHTMCDDGYGYDVLLGKENKCSGGLVYYSCCRLWSKFLDLPERSWEDQFICCFPSEFMYGMPYITQIRSTGYETSKLLRCTIWLS